MLSDLKIAIIRMNDTHAYLDLHQEVFRGPHHAEYRLAGGYARRNSLLILDEPTDGFSKEQLGRLRDVLRELNCEQVIIVSYKKELESFVDRIYHVTKENGKLGVEPPVV